MIKKGRITNVYDDGTYRVESADIPGDISAPISIQEGMDVDARPLKKDDVVIYVLFNDQTGLIMGRM